MSLSHIFEIFHPQTWIHHFLANFLFSFDNFYVELSAEVSNIKASNIVRIFLPTLAYVKVKSISSL